MEEFKIIKAEPEHTGAIHQLIADVLGDYHLYHLRPPYVDDDIKDLEEQYFNNKGYFWVVLDHDGAVIGSCAIGRIDNYNCELRKMYLKKSYQGRGIGKLLMQTAVTMAKQIGYATIMLKTNSKLDTAVQLYKKYGFTAYTISDVDKKADCDVAMYRLI